MRILVDMDGVMADLYDSWLYLIRAELGLDITLEDITHWGAPSEFLGEHARRAYDLFDRPGFFFHLKPIPGAVDAIRTLKAAGHDVVFVTSCFSGHVDKRRWLKEHLTSDFDARDIIYTHRKGLIHGDVLIDDAEHNLEDFKQESPGGIAICFDAPHNKTYPGIRASDWGDVLRKIEIINVSSKEWKPS